MIEKIRQAIQHPLISGSAISVGGSMVANIFNYFYNLSMGRMLSVAEYGILASLISLFSIFVVFGTTITMVFSKFTASFMAKDKGEFVGILLRRGTITIGGISLFVTIILTIFSSYISQFLNIKESILITIVALALFFNFLGAVLHGILQGLLKFVTFSLVYIVMSTAKFLIGVGLVFLGFKIFGAVFAILIAGILGYIISLIPLRKHLLIHKSDHLTLQNLHRELSTYALPVLLSTIGLTALVSIDVILVKHYFLPVNAGQYGALSLMGRTIFFVVNPIIFVFFSVIAHKREKKEKLFKTIIAASIIIGIPSLFLLTIYFFFPSLVLRIFFPAKEYLVLSSYLGLFSVFIVFYTFSHFLTSFYLSIGKTRVFAFVLLATLFEIIYIIFFHKTIMQIVLGLIGISFFFLVSLILFYLFSKKN